MIFLDSNIIVYMYDEREPRKRETARELVRQRLADCCISVQVLAEVSVTLLYKIEPRQTDEQISEVLRALGEIRIHRPDMDTVTRAMEFRKTYGVHFYDGMILAAAERMGCDRVLSEDLNAGQDYFGVRVENPFA